MAFISTVEAIIKLKIRKMKANCKKLIYQATVPANTIATLYLPASSEKNVTEGGKPANGQKGIRFIEFRNGKAVFELQSGSYQFMAE